MKKQSTSYEESQRLHKAKRQWERSEKILNILRTQTSQPIKQPTEEELIVWYQKARPQSAN